MLSRNARDNLEHFDETMDNWIDADSSAVLEAVLQNRAGYDFINVYEKRVKRMLLLDELIFISETRDANKTAGKIIL